MGHGSKSSSSQEWREIVQMQKQKLYSYVRWSSDRQTQGTTLERQTKAAKEFAARHSLEMVEIIDSGLSAFKGKNLSDDSALGGFIKAVEAGAIPQDSWLYVENLDRLSRQEVTKANELFLRLLNLGLTVVTGMDQKIYTSKSVNENPTDLMLSILLFSRANEESRTKQKRVLGNVQALVDRYNQGLPVNIKSVGNHPFWIDDSGSQYEAVKPHPIFFQAAKDAIRLFLDGWGAYRVTEYLTEHYSLPKARKHKKAQDSMMWPIQLMRTMRNNRALVGERVVTVMGIEYRLKDYYPPLCTETEFARLQEIKAKNNSYQGEKTKSIPLLSGLNILKCGHCKGPMSHFVQRRGSKQTLRYVCESARSKRSTCPVWTVQAYVVERCLMEELYEAFLSSTLGSETDTTALEAAIQQQEEQIEVLDSTIQRLTDALIAGGNLPAIVERMQTLETEKSACLLQLDRLNQRRLLAGSREDVRTQIKEFESLCRQEVIADPFNPERLKLREFVRKLMVNVSLFKTEGKLKFIYQHQPLITKIYQSTVYNSFSVTSEVIENFAEVAAHYRPSFDINKVKDKVVFSAMRKTFPQLEPINGKDFWPRR